MVWIVFACMTAATVLCVVWPLTRPLRAVRGSERDVDFYRAQIGELDMDVGRGMLPAGEVAEVKAELGRRLLAAADHADAASPPLLGWARVMVAIVTVGLIPAVALGLYLKVGSPSYPDEPLAARAAAGTSIADAVERVEAHLASHPDDGRGYELIAPVYMQSGRFDDAVHAYSQALRILGDTPLRQAAYGQALVMAADGVVTAAARGAFETALKTDPGLPQARFFIGVAAEQDGDKAQARAIWQKLEADAPPDAPWLDVVRHRLAGLDAPAPAAAAGMPAGPAAAGIAALPPEQRNAAIRGMVDGLAARLGQNGHDADGWLRLVRAYTVLGETEKAKAALGDARRSLTGDDSALSRLDGLARELGLEG